MGSTGRSQGLPARLLGLQLHDQRLGKGDFPGQRARPDIERDEVGAGSHHQRDVDHACHRQPLLELRLAILLAHFLQPGLGHEIDHRLGHRLGSGEDIHRQLEKLAQRLAQFAAFGAHDDAGKFEGTPSISALIKTCGNSAMTEAASAVPSMVVVWMRCARSTKATTVLSPSR
ncbi:MAG: hypothetical protein QM796_11990 [Chthoniobacteraceae bacterium]